MPSTDTSSKNKQAGSKLSTPSMSKPNKASQSQGEWLIWCECAWPLLTEKKCN